MSDEKLISAHAEDGSGTLDVGDLTVGEAVERLRNEAAPTRPRIPVVEGGRFVGFIAAERLLTAGGEVPARSLVEDVPVIARGDERAEAVANRAAGSGSGVVAVVDRDGNYIGLVPPRRISALLIQEHEEDLARLGGYRAAGAEAQRAAREPVPRRLMHRLPWLLIGLMGAMASTLLVASFEDEIQQVVLLAFFVPAVVYMADAVGTQTETVLIRAMAAGVTVREMLRRELLTGLALGVVVALLFFPFAALAWGDTQVAAAVALSLFAACGTATAVAMTLPAILSRLGLDPAFGAGPLATVAQDLLSLVVYFAIAVPIAT